MESFDSKNRLLNMELIIERDIESIRNNRYTDDRETLYRKHFKAIKEFFGVFSAFNVRVDHPEFRKLSQEGSYLAARILVILEEDKVFDHTSYLKFLEIFKKLIAFREESEKLNELLQYLHL